MIDPRMLEHAVNATMRVREDINGSKSSIERPIAYELVGERERGFQYLIVAFFFEASFFQGPQFAMESC